MIYTQQDLLGGNPQVQQMADKGLPSSPISGMPGLSDITAQNPPGPQEAQGMSLPGFAGNVAGNAMNWLKQSPPGQLAQNVLDPQGAQQEREQMAQGVLKLPGMIGNELTHPGKIPGDILNYAYNNPLDAALMAGQALESIPSSVKEATGNAANFVRHPIGTTGKNMEAAVKSAGSVDPALLDKTLGTLNKPNPDLIKGIQPAAGPVSGPDVSELLKKEIAATRGGIGEPSYEQIMSNKKGADVAARWSSGQAPTSQQLFYKNISRKYADILKEGVPNYEHLSNAYKAMKMLQNLPTNVLKAVIPGSFLTKILGL